MAVPKGKIIEGIIQKAVELGAGCIVPLLTERVVTHLDDDGAEGKREKWQLVAIEAIKQCGAGWLPQVETPQTISEFLACAGRRSNWRWSVHCRQSDGIRASGSWNFKAARRRLPRSAAVWIGPEGDFTLEEIRQIEGAGAKPITLGTLTLRVETAAIYCLSFLNYELNPAVR